MGKTDGEEDPDGWSKPIGKKGRGKKNTKNADDFARLLPSSTRTGKAYQCSNVTKEDDQKGFCVRRLFGECICEKKENVAQLSTGTIAAQAVANAAAEEAAATTTHGLINAELKPEQLSIDTTAAQTVANAAAEEAAADAAVLERAAAEQTVASDIDAVEHAAAIIADAEAAATVNNLHDEIKHLQLLLATERAIFHAAPESAIAVQAVIDPFKRVAINADAEAAATVNNMRGEIKRLQLLLATEQAAAADARAAANEAAATINRLEEENKRILLQLAAEQAATTAKVYIPGYSNPMTQAEYQRALQRQIQYLQDQLHWHAQAIPVQWPGWADGTSMASSNPVPVFANEPPWKEHIQSQPGATIAKSNPATYAQAVTNSEPSLSSTMKRSTRAQDIDRDHSANAASASATADPASAIMMSPTVLQHNLADHAKATALQAAADAAAAAATDPKILRAVLLAAAATANALASTIPLDAVTTHRRGGRPPKTRRANPRPRPRRTQRSAGPPAPRVTDTHTAMQSRRTQQGQHNPPTANSLLREGQNRPRPGAPFTSSNHAASSAMPATHFAPPLSPAVTRRNGRNIADSAKPRMTQGQHNPPTANSLLSLREGQNRPRPGAPFTSSNHAASSAMPAPRFAPPLSPAVTRRNGRDIAESL